MLFSHSLTLNTTLTKRYIGEIVRRHGQRRTGVWSQYYGVVRGLR